VMQQLVFVSFPFFASGVTLTFFVGGRKISLMMRVQPRILTKMGNRPLRGLRAATPDSTEATPREDKKFFGAQLSYALSHMVGLWWTVVDCGRLRWTRWTLAVSATLRIRPV
jgi:hypothetical protein